jgi:hypothetical protein
VPLIPARKSSIEENTARLNSNSPIGNQPRAAIFENIFD